MNTISGSSTFSTGASSGGISGLVSGMDTESMVESMLSGTQNKIDKANADKQVTTWKQEMYRDIITKINTFQNSFFGKGSKTNLTSADFFNSMSAACGNSSIKVVASSSAAVGRTEIQVAQLATASKMQSAESVSGTLSSKVNLDAIKRTLVLDVAGTEKTIDLTGASSAADIATKLTDAGVSASVNDKGNLVIAGSDIRVSSKSSKLGLEMTGLAAGNKTGDTATLTSTVNTDAAASMDVVLNGVKYSVSLKGVDDAVFASDDPTQQMANLQDFLQTRIDAKVGGLNSANIRPVTVQVSSDGTMTMTTSGKGQEVYLSGNQHGLKLLGIRDGQSNKINKNQSLQNVNFNTGLQGSTYKFSINGEQFSFTSDTKLSEVMNSINNNTNAGVRITYSELEDKFTIESAATGAGRDIQFSQTEGNLLNAMFGNLAGATTGSTASSKSLVTDAVSKDSAAWDAIKGLNSFSEGSFKLTMNGTTYAIPVPEKDTNYTRSELQKVINEGLADRFGYEGTQQAIELVGNDTDGYQLAVRNGYKVKIADDTTIYKDGVIDSKLAQESAGNGNLALAFGLNKVDNVAKSKDATLSSVGIADGPLTIGSTTLTVDSTTKIDDLLTALETGLGVTAKFEDGKIIVSGTGSHTLPSEIGDLFGTNNLILNGQQTGRAESKLHKGQNALVTINGVDTERTSNTFSVNGLTVTLNDTTGSYIQLGEHFTEGADSFWKDAEGNKYYLGSDQGITKILLADGITTIDAGTTVTEDNKALKSIIGAKVDATGYLLDNNGVRMFTGDTAKIDTTRDTESIVKGMQSFVEEYNKLIADLNGKVSEKDTSREYAPLTAAQKKEMSEKEIELWEEKSKGGLLRNDSEISSLLQGMRSILYSKPEGSQYGLYDIGIETSDNWKDKGKLTLDESALRGMLETNPQAVQELFTTAQSGLANSMNEAIDRVANINSSKAGTLVQMAGVVGKTTELTNDLSKRLREINANIKDLQKRYETEKARYWNQFNSMENMLSQMNSQSSWLAQQFA